MAGGKPAQGNGADQETTYVHRNPHVRLLFCGDDEVVVKHGSRSRFTKNIRDEGRTRLLGKILRNADTPFSVAQLAERGVLKPGELDDAQKLVDYLRQEGVLVKPGEDPVDVYLATILGAEQPLSKSTVGIAGAGFLGSRIAAHLARLGVGKLLVLDDRVIRHATVDRRYFDFMPGGVTDGRPYSECLAEHLAAHGFHNLEVRAASLDDEGAMRSLIESCDFTIVALESFSARVLHLANSLAIDHRRPWMSTYADGSEILVGPLYVPGETCCYNEFEIQHEATLGGMKNDYLLYKEALNEERIHGAHFILPPYLDMAASLAVTAAIQFLASRKSFLVGRANRIDFERLSIDYEEVLRLPRCPACTPTQPGYRHLFM